MSCKTRTFVHVICFYISLFICLATSSYTIAQLLVRPNDQIIKPITTPEVLDIDITSSCYGVFEFVSGTIVDDCTESYEISSNSLFIITDGHGNKMVAYGPLKIEANQYINFDEQVCFKGFDDLEYRFKGDVVDISDYPCFDGMMESNE